MPEFTVVVPAWNAALYLATAVESALAQREVELEVVVVDDGSTDETGSILAGFGPPVRMVRQENQGVAAARNRGIAEARGKFVAFLDADDLWEPGKLGRQSRALRDAPGARASASAFMVVDDRGGVLATRGGPTAVPLLDALLLEGNVIGTPSSVVVERALLETTGGFDPALSQCADWELWIRLALSSGFAVVAEPLVRYRQHAGNMSRSVPLLAKDSRRVLDKAFARTDLPPALRKRRREALGRNERVLAGSYYRAGLYADFLRCAARAVLYSPREVGYLAGMPLRRLGRRHG